MIKNLSLTILFTLTYGVIGCASESSSNGHQKLVGLWESTNPDVNSIILRQPDGTFFEKKIQRYDHAHPPVEYTTEGKWQVQGKYYVFEYSYISFAPWQAQIGKKWKVEIVKAESEAFSYISTDGADVRENKIGEASYNQFRKRDPKALKNDDGIRSNG